MALVERTTQKANAWSMESALKAIPSHFSRIQSMAEKAFTLSTDEDIKMMEVLT